MQTIQAFLDYCSVAHFHAIGAKVHSINGVLFGESGLESPLLNGVLQCNFNTSDIEPTVDSIFTHFKTKDLAHSWWINTSNSSKKLKEELNKRGLDSLGDFTGQFIYYKTAKAPQTCLELSIEIVQTEDELREWSTIITQAFHLCSADVETYFTIFKNTLKSESFFHVIGRKDGKAVSTASLLLTPSGAYIYNLATTEQERCKGYASNLLYAILRKADLYALPYVGLVSSPMAQSLCNNLGFEIGTTYTIYA